MESNLSLHACIAGALSNEPSPQALSTHNANTERGMDTFVLSIRELKLREIKQHVCGHIVGAGLMTLRHMILNR